MLRFIEYFVTVSFGLYVMMGAPRYNRRCVLVINWSWIGIRKPSISICNGEEVGYNDLTPHPHTHTHFFIARSL